MTRMTIAALAIVEAIEGISIKMSADSDQIPSYQLTHSDYISYHIISKWQIAGDRNQDINARSWANARGNYAGRPRVLSVKRANIIPEKDELFGRIIFDFVQDREHLLKSVRQSLPTIVMLTFWWHVYAKTMTGKLWSVGTSPPHLITLITPLSPMVSPLAKW